MGLPDRKESDRKHEPCPMAGHCWHWYGSVDYCCDCDEERENDCEC